MKLILIRLKLVLSAIKQYKPKNEKEEDTISDIRTCCEDAIKSLEELINVK